MIHRRVRMQRLTTNLVGHMTIQMHSRRCSLLLIIMMRERTILVSRLLVVNVHKLSGDRELSFQMPFNSVDIHMLQCVLEFLRDVDHFKKTLRHLNRRCGVTHGDVSLVKLKEQIRLVHTSTGWQGEKIPRLSGALKTAERAQRTGREKTRGSESTFM